MIRIDKNDVLDYIYFICSKSSYKMYGGLTGKLDLIGGIFDRWINTIPEGIIFNDYYLPKIDEKITAINDFYVYDPKKVGIAPDLIGVNFSGKKIPFVKFTSEGIRPVEGAPQIEVKTFKESGYLLSLRNQSYDGKYLILLNLELNSDYLISFMDEMIFSDEVFTKLEMDDDVFFDHIGEISIEKTKKIEKKDEIGRLEVLSTTTSDAFMETCDLASGGISPHFIKNIKDTRNVKKPGMQLAIKDFMVLDENVYRFNDAWYEFYPLKEIISLAWTIENIDVIHITRVSKSSIHVKMIGGSSRINGMDFLENQTYILEMSTIGRAGNKNEEYFMHKSISNMIKNEEEKMLSEIKDFIDSFDD